MAAKWITERFSNPTRQQARATELRAQGNRNVITRFLGSARRSSQPQRTPATEGSFVVQYLPQEDSK